MGRWRIKFVILLIAYFAGFTTAVYMMAPESKAPSGHPSSTTMISGAMPDLTDQNQKKFTDTINTGIQKCVEFSLNLARQTCDIIREELHNHQSSSSPGKES